MCVHITHPLIKSRARLRTGQPRDTARGRERGRAGLAVVEEGGGGGEETVYTSQAAEEEGGWMDRLQSLDWWKTGIGDVRCKDEII